MKRTACGGCFGSVREAGEVYVVDSQSTDGTVDIAESCGAKLAQFHYRNVGRMHDPIIQHNVESLSRYILMQASRLEGPIRV